MKNEWNTYVLLKNYIIVTNKAVRKSYRNIFKQPQNG